MEFLKGEINTDAHLYEIDKEKLKNIYNFTKKSNKFQIIEKKIIFASGEKENTGISTKDNFQSKSLKNSTNNKNNENIYNELEKYYYSDFKQFKEYLSSGFKSEETKTEITDIKNLLETSKNLRQNLSKHFNIQKDDVEEREPISKENSVNSLIKRAQFFKKFVKICNLLTLKQEDKKEQLKPSFKFYSELNNPSDIYSFTPNENFLMNKLLNFQKKLTKGYYQEEFFCEFAANYFSSNINMNQSEIPLADSRFNSQSLISPEIRQRFPVDYIDSIFKSRESESFLKLDTFMSKHENQRAMNKERDLYENIYSVLSKSNYSNFLSFLYSKNPLFKFIYDEFAFSQRRDNLGILDSQMSQIDHREDSAENSDFFLPQHKSSQTGFIRRQTIRSNVSHQINTNDFLGSYYLDKISFLNEKIDETIFDTLTNEFLDNKNLMYSTKAVECLKASMGKEFNYILLINKHERIKIINYTEEELYGIQNKTEIDEDPRNFKFFKISTDNLHKRFQMNTNIILDELDKYFYILELKNIVQRKPDVSQHKFSLSQKHMYSSYYLFRVNPDHIKRFELIINHLRLFDNFELRNKETRVSVQTFNNNVVHSRGSSFGVRKSSDDTKRKSEDYVERNFKASIFEGDVLNQSGSMQIDDVVKEDFLESKKPLSNYILEKKEIGPCIYYNNLVNSGNDSSLNPKFRKDLNTFGSNNDESLYSSNEINFKSYIFTLTSKCKFLIREENGNNLLVYYPIDEESRKNIINFKDFKNYSVKIEDFSGYFNVDVKLRFKDSRPSLDFKIIDKNDYSGFNSKLEKLLPKLN